MSPRHLKVIVLLLPLLVVRSMLPAGFMVSFEAGAARLVFCAGEVTVPQSGGHEGHDLHAGHPGQEHHHGTDERRTDEARHGDHQTCPFAFAAAAPTAAALAFAAEIPPTEGIASPHYGAIVAGVSRAHPIRGPPARS